MDVIASFDIGTVGHIKKGFKGRLFLFTVFVCHFFVSNVSLHKLSHLTVYIPVTPGTPITPTGTLGGGTS